MFGLGAVLTLMTLSVSVSLGLLVPLHDRRIVRAKHVVPYIMGANITTFVDTLLAAMTMEQGSATAVVLVEMAAVTAVSLLVLGPFYGRYERAMLAAVDRVTARRRNLRLFLAVLLVLPVTLLMLPRLL
jgi:Na+/phosphate symporter